MLTPEQSQRVVELIDKIMDYVKCGIDLPSDLCIEAEELGLDVAGMTILVGECYEDQTTDPEE